MVNPETLAYFTQFSPTSDPKEFLPLLQVLPSDIPQLVKIIQGLFLHIFWANRYSVELSEERKSEVNLRKVHLRLKRLLELNGSPLDQARPPAQRLVGNCRDFSQLLSTCLRAKGIPARARCGFGIYFEKDRFVDHWVTEVWNTGESRWVMVDSQLDDLQCSALKLDFDPLDMPTGKFILAGEAWRMCRTGTGNADSFGIFEWHGMNFIAGNVWRDLLSLQRIELLPWDDWDMLNQPFRKWPRIKITMLDEAASLTLEKSDSPQRIAHFIEGNELFQPPTSFMS